MIAPPIPSQNNNNNNYNNNDKTLPAHRQENRLSICIILTWLNHQIENYNRTNFDNIWIMILWSIYKIDDFISRRCQNNFNMVPYPRHGIEVTFGCHLFKTFILINVFTYLPICIHYLSVKWTNFVNGIQEFVSRTNWLRFHRHVWTVHTIHSARVKL